MLPRRLLPSTRMAHGMAALVSLVAQVPDRMPCFDSDPNEWRKGDERLRSLGTPKYKAKRNDPCPCGSGRKFKKCCIDLKKSERYDDVQDGVQDAPQEAES